MDIAILLLHLVGISLSAFLYVTLRMIHLKFNERMDSLERNVSNVPNEASKEPSKDFVQFDENSPVHVDDKTKYEIEGGDTVAPPGYE